MRLRNLLIAAMTAMVLVSCQKDGETTNEEGNNEKAYIAFSIKGTSVSGREPGTANGSPEESTVASAVIVTFDDKANILSKIELKTVADNKTDAHEVKSTTKKVFVVVNPTTEMLTLIKNGGTSWATLSAALATAPTSGWSTDMTAKLFTTSLAADNKFVMSSAKGLDAVTTYPNKTDALKNAKTITVDRMVAKIAVGVIVPPTIENGDFTFTAWEMNTVNKTTSMYNEIEADYVNEDGGTYPAHSVYRKDQNYTGYKAIFNAVDAGDGVADAAKKKFMDDNFYWLTNGTNRATMSKFDNVELTSTVDGATKYEYVTENTMDAESQLRGATTKLVIKAKYTPNNITKGESYFFFGGAYYSVADMEAGYKADLLGGNLVKKDLAEFLTACEAGTLTEASDDAAFAAAMAKLDNYSGVNDKVKGLAIRYYHLSECYYDVLVRHDSNKGVNMELGRYGVVRNNSYTINLSSVRGPGTPWIPDPKDPKDPSKPGTPDDEDKAYLAVVIEVNPWVTWKQDADLE